MRPVTAPQVDEDKDMARRVRATVLRILKYGTSRSASIVFLCRRGCPVQPVVGLFPGNALPIDIQSRKVVTVSKSRFLAVVGMFALVAMLASTVHWHADS